MLAASRSTDVMADITRTVFLEGGGQTLTMRRFTLTPESASAVTFGQRVVTIGTHPDNDLPVSGPGVSRFHCRVEVGADGYRVIDRGSKNGTFLNEVRVRDAWLEPGAVLHVGGVEVAFDVTDDEIEVRLSGRTSFGGLVGRSEAMREVFAVLERLAPTDLTVLVDGPSGTGKELAAEAIHEHSARRDGPFVVFDCSAVAHDLIESELFGHVRGAFTGAHAARQGAFEQAHGGTLFLDEIGELDLDLQPKLLRALEKRSVRRVGGNETVPVDVRIVAATNRDLREEVERGGFREDLYYRLAVARVALPALSSRPEDIPLLVEHFVKDVRERLGVPGLSLAWSTLERLQAHPWPGNVRELRNFVERAAALAGADGDVPTRLLDLPAPPNRAGAPDGGDWLAAAGVALDAPFKDAKNQLVETFERAYWEAAMERADGNVSQAARDAGVHRKSVEYILRKLS